MFSATMLSLSRIILSLTVFSALVSGSSLQKRQYTCTVPPGGSSSIDDAPAIIAAFKECNTNSGKVIFTNHTYHINSVMKITGLKNVDVDIKGTLLVCATLHLMRIELILFSVVK
jgi:galacturan 1,4-alpha-galacturonidase